MLSNPPTAYSATPLPSSNAATSFTPAANGRFVPVTTGSVWKPVHAVPVHIATPGKGDALVFTPSSRSVNGPNANRRGPEPRSITRIEALLKVAPRPMPVHVPVEP